MMEIKDSDVNGIKDYIKRMTDFAYELGTLSMKIEVGKVGLSLDSVINVLSNELLYLFNTTKERYLNESVNNYEIYDFISFYKNGVQFTLIENLDTDRKLQNKYLISQLNVGVRHSS